MHGERGEAGLRVGWGTCSCSLFCLPRRRRKDCHFPRHCPAKISSQEALPTHCCWSVILMMALVPRLFGLIVNFGGKAEKTKKDIWKRMFVSLLMRLWKWELIMLSKKGPMLPPTSSVWMKGRLGLQLKTLLLTPGVPLPSNCVQEFPLKVNKAAFHREVCRLADSS